MAVGPHQDTPTLEQQVAILKQQLAQAQKMTALGQLVSTTTHEFNNVLTTIINYAKIGLRHKDEATRDKAFTKVLSAGNRAAQITNSVLAIARKRSGKQEPTDLVKLVEDTLVLLEREMNKYRVVVDKHFHSIPEAFVDGNQIQQVLLNLLVNARQAMERGGRLMIKLSYDQATDMIDLMVRDTGCGIPPEKLPRIFDAFFTTKSGPDASGKGGTGLGLAMCREILEAHHGRIRVDSSVGKGTAFTLKLPTVTKAASRQTQIGAPVPPPIGVPGTSPVSSG